MQTAMHLKVRKCANSSASLPAISKVITRGSWQFQILVSRSAKEEAGVLTQERVASTPGCGFVGQNW